MKKGKSDNSGIRLINISSLSVQLLFYFLYCMSKKYPFYIVTYCIKWVTTSWTEGTTLLYPGILTPKGRCTLRSPRRRSNCTNCPTVGSSWAVDSGNLYIYIYMIYTGWPRSYRKYIEQITQPSQYGYAKLQHIFAVTSGSPSIYVFSFSNNWLIKRCTENDKKCNFIVWISGPSLTLHVCWRIKVGVYIFSNFILFSVCTCFGLFW